MKLMISHIITTLCLYANVFSMQNNDISLHNNPPSTEQSIEHVREKIYDATVYINSIKIRAKAMSHNNCNLIHPKVTKSVSEKLQSIINSLTACTQILKNIKNQQTEQDQKQLYHVATQTHKTNKTLHHKAIQTPEKATLTQNSRIKNKQLHNMYKDNNHFDPHDFACYDTRKTDKLKRQQKHLHKK